MYISCTGEVAVFARGITLREEGNGVLCRLYSPGRERNWNKGKNYSTGNVVFMFCFNLLPNCSSDTYQLKDRCDVCAIGAALTSHETNPADAHA